MRISMDKDDPGYHGGIFQGTRVFLDNDELRNVETADDKEGIVIVYVTDEKGSRLIENNDVVRKTLHGNVKLILPRNIPKHLIPSD